MRKPIVLLNLLLLAAVLGMAAGIRAAWQRNHMRYVVLGASSRLAGGSGFGAGAQAPPALLDYGELVNRNLFSSDRNNVQPVVKKDKKQAPPAPVVIGTMNLGSGMVALMADARQAANGAFKRVKTGDEIGMYKVIEIAEHKVVVEFDGEKTTLDVYESAASVAGRAAAAYSAPAPASQVQTAVAAAAAGPGETGAPVTQAGGSSSTAPTAVEGVTIEGNQRVTRKMSPFGMMTYREAVAPQQQQKPQ